MGQLHKRFSVEQIKMLFESYLHGTIVRAEVEEILQINKTRFFALVKEYRQAQDRCSTKSKGNYLDTVPSAERTHPALFQLRKGLPVYHLKTAVILVSVQVGCDAISADQVASKGTRFHIAQGGEVRLISIRTPYLVVQVRNRSCNYGTIRTGH